MKLPRFNKTQIENLLIYQIKRLIKSKITSNYYCNLDLEYIVLIYSIATYYFYLNMIL